MASVDVGRVCEFAIRGTRIVRPNIAPPPATRPRTREARVKLVVFGLSISSSWGNGHATLWRALCRALTRRGHHTVFFERDVPYYAAHRDLLALEGVELVLYDDLSRIRARAEEEIADADVAMVTSYCPDAVAASALVAEHAQ